MSVDTYLQLISEGFSTGVVFNNLPAVHTLDMASWVTAFLPQCYSSLYSLQRSCVGAAGPPLLRSWDMLSAGCSSPALAITWQGLGHEGATSTDTSQYCTFHRHLPAVRGPGHSVLCSPGLARSSECCCSSSTALPGVGTSNSMSKEAGVEISLCWMLLPAGRRACSVVRAFRDLSEDG